MNIPFAARFTPGLRWLVAGITAAAAWSASAATVGIGLDVAFDGGTPSGKPPYATASFTDVGKNVVRLSLTTSAALEKTAFFSDFYLNFGPNSGTLLDPGLLVFTYNENLSKGPKPLEVNQKAPNEYKAGGDGLYDIQLEFATSNSGDERFGPGESVVFDITAAVAATAATTAATRADLFTFDAFTFFNLSCNEKQNPDCQRAGRSGPFAAAAHLQGLDGGASAWIASTTEVPLPAAAWLLVGGLFTLWAAGRRNRRTRA